MRSLTYVIVGLFSIYSIQPPRAFAAPSLDDNAKAIVSAADDSQIRFLDSEQRPIAGKDLLEGRAETFYALTEVGNRTLQIKVSVASDGTGFSLAASDTEDDAKVLSRRAFKFSPTESAEAAKLRLLQTVKSMEKEIGTKWAVAFQPTALTKALLALQSLFGIPSAHAEESALAIKVIYPIVGGVALLAAIASIYFTLKGLSYHQTQTTGLTRGRLIVLEYALVGAMGLLIHYYCTEILGKAFPTEKKEVRNGGGQW